MTKTRKVNKDMCWANNLILENDLGVLEVSLYTDINGIVIILGLGFFISLVNLFLIIPLSYFYLSWGILRTKTNPVIMKPTGR